MSDFQVEVVEDVFVVEDVPESVFEIEIQDPDVFTVIEVGLAGPQGPTGPQGPAGASGSTIYVGNIDGGAPDSIYGGSLQVIDGGNP